MISIFFVSALSADHSKYKTCELSPFCSRNINQTEQSWIADPTSAKLEKDQFSMSVNSNFTLTIDFLRLGSIHVRILPQYPEPFRYDSSSEPTVIDPKALSSKSQPKLSKDTNYILLENGPQLITVYYNPLRIEYRDEHGKNLRSIINPVVFETNISKEEKPELFESKSWGGHTDSFKNGPTAVGADATFFGSSIKLSGLASHTLPLTIPNTDESGPIRFFNTDIHRYEVNVPMAMYGAVPFLWGHSLDPHHIGFLWLNPSETWVNVSYLQDSVKTRFLSEGGLIDIYLSSESNPENLIDQYTQLTGRPNMAPLFSIGFHQCRWGYMTQEEINDVDTALDELSVPHDVMWLDLDHTDDRQYFTWHPTNFKNPKKMLSKLAANHRYLVTLSDPHLKATTSYPPYNEATSKGLTIKNGDGNEFKGNCWPGQSAWPDFFNPATREWWEKWYSYEKYTGSSSNLFPWNDMNEISVFDSADGTALRDLIHHGNIEEREVHNMYGHLMISSTWGGLLKRNKDQNLRPFILTRSFFVGSQRYSAVWSGDNTGDWSHLANSVQLVLHYSICGIHHSGVDVGGFFDSPAKKLIARWYNVGAWIYPFYRCHCHHLSEKRELNQLTGEDFEVAKEGLYQRYQYLPYWYLLMRRANLTGSPLVRPLWWRYPKIQDRDDIALLGDALLVVPFLHDNADDIQFDFPNQDIFYPIDSIPFDQHLVTFDKGKTRVFQIGGSIVPIKTRIRKSSELMQNDPFTLNVCLDKDGNAQGELYADDGVSFDFAKGQMIHKKIEFNSQKMTSVDAESVNSEFDFPAIIERITVKGLQKKPTRIIIDGRDLEFDFSDQILVIHRINVMAKSNWTIEFI